MELFFDTETSDKFDFKNPVYKSSRFPWCVQIGAVLAHEGIIYGEMNLLVKADGRIIADGAAAVHNITTEEADRYGISEKLMAKTFIAFVNNADRVVAHNYQFDSLIMASVLHRNGFELDALNLLDSKPWYCTMLGTTDLCKLPGRFGKYKWPKLEELHKKLFGEGFSGAHDAMFDIKATMRCYYELWNCGWLR